VNVVFSTVDATTGFVTVYSGPRGVGEWCNVTMIVVRKPIIRRTVKRNTVTKGALWKKSGRRDVIF
jgi:hypothetical protein